MACSKVSGKFFTDNLGSSLLLWGIFPFLTDLTKQKQYPRSRENFSPCNFNTAIPQRKRRSYNFPFRCFYIKRNSSKQTQLIPNHQPSMYILIFSFHYKLFPVLFCSNYKGPVCCTEIQHRVLTCYFRYIYVVVWASCVANTLMNTTKALNIFSRWKSEVDIHYENLLINRSLLK